MESYSLPHSQSLPLMQQCQKSYCNSLQEDSCGDLLWIGQNSFPYLGVSAGFIQTNKFASVHLLVRTYAGRGKYLVATIAADLSPFRIWSALPCPCCHLPQSISAFLHLPSYTTSFSRSLLIIQWHAQEAFGLPSSAPTVYYSVKGHHH